MFTHHTLINAEHHVALESVIRNHWVAHEQQLALLYKAALANLTASAANQEKECASVIKTAGVLFSTLRDPTVTVSVATDAESGVYIQLAHPKDHPPGKAPLMTVGQKMGGGKSVLSWNCSYQALVGFIVATNIL